MGRVYLAHDARLNRKVALKVLPPDLINSHERITRFEQEGRLWNRCGTMRVSTICCGAATSYRRGNLIKPANSGSSSPAPESRNSDSCLRLRVARNDRPARETVEESDVRAQ